MKALSLSLIVTLLVASVGLTLLLDNVYERSINKNESLDQLGVIEVFSENIAYALDNMGQPEQFLDHWRQDNFKLSLLEHSQLPLPEALQRRLQSSLPVLLETQDSLAIYHLLPKHKLLLQVTAANKLISDSEWSVRFWLTIVFYCSLLALTILWLYPLLKRLQVLRSATNAFGQGKLAQRIPLGKVSYIKDIETEFNHMAQRIENLVDDIKLLTGAVSHELRNPLARIRMGLDMLEEESCSSRRERYQQKLSRDLDEMEALVESLLYYARFDRNLELVKKLPIDLQAIVKNCIHRQSSKDVTIALSNPTGKTSIVGDMDTITMAVSNLLQNAINYGNGRVSLKLLGSANTVTLSVEDDGPGIESSVGQDILKPFVRGNQTKVKGYGMGLAIVKRILDWHQGTIAITRSESLGGAKFIVTFTAH